MNTDVEGNYSLSGSIFLHAENNPHFTDFNNIIYGHHMEKHMMFGDIGEFTNQNFFNKHHYGNLYYDGINHGIEFIAIMQLDAYNERAFNVCISEEAKQEYIKLIDSNSLYKRNVQISPNDHLVILTTCTSDMTNGRNVLVGKITNKTYPEKIKKNKGIGIDILNNNTYLELILILIALIIAVFVYLSGHAGACCIKNQLAKIRVHVAIFLSTKYSIDQLFEIRMLRNCRHKSISNNVRHMDTESVSFRFQSHGTFCIT